MPNVKISELPALVTAVGTDELPVVQSGTTKKITMDDIKLFANPTGQFGCTFSGTVDIPADSFCDVILPYSMTLEEVTMLANAAGSVVVDIWVDSYANFPPTVADSITASSPPTLATSNKSINNTLTGWTTSIVGGSTIRFSVVSCTGISQLTIILKGSKT